MTRKNSKIIWLDRRRDDASSFALQNLIATIGFCLVVLPIVGELPFGWRPAWIGACCGGAALVLAIGSAIRPRSWQTCTQAVLGCAVVLIPATMQSSSVSESLATLCGGIGGILIGFCALAHLAELRRAGRRNRHRGWRSPPELAQKGPRLVYVSDRAGQPASPDV